MSVELREEDGGKIVEIRIVGTLHKSDYEYFVPELDRLIKQHAKISMLVQMEDFSGWDAGALWEDVKFGVRHFTDIERLAMVGDKRWQKAMSAFCKPFTTAEVRYYEPEQMDEARVWLRSG